MRARPNNGAERSRSTAAEHARLRGCAAHAERRTQIILRNCISAMRPIRIIVAAALSVFTVACAEPPKRVNPVGLSFAAYEDSARRSWTGPQDRPLATAVWVSRSAGKSGT